MTEAGERIELTGSVALVTGAARGIGLASARRLGRCGARVAICDRLDDELSKAVAALEGDGLDVLAEVLDVRDTPAVNAFTDRIAAEYGPVSVLVNNAGGTFAAPFLDVNEKGEASMIAENFTQASHLIRTLAPAMPRGSSIINVTSIEAHQAAPGFAIYAAMKTALESLSRTLALELAPAGIRLNCVAPDAIPSEGDAGVREQLLGGPVPYDPAYLPPLGRFGTYDDAASAVLFLASTFSSFITGTTIHLDGGNFAAGGWRYRGDQAADDRS